MTSWTPNSSTWSPDNLYISWVDGKNVLFDNQHLPFVSIFSELEKMCFFKWKNLLVAYFKGNGLYLVYKCYKLTPPWLTELEKTIEMVFLLFLEPEESTENGFHKIEDDAEIWDLIKSSYTFNISWRELLGGEQLQFVTS